MRHYTCILLKSTLLSCDIFFHFWMATVIMLVIIFGLTIVVCNVAYVGFSRCYLSRDQKNLMKELWHNSWVYVVNQSHFFLFLIWASNHKYYYCNILGNYSMYILCFCIKKKGSSLFLIKWTFVGQIWEKFSQKLPFCRETTISPLLLPKKKFVIIMLKMSPHFFPWSIPRFQFLFFHFL